MTEKTVFGRLEEKEVYLYTIKNSRGISLQVMNYGACIVSLNVPDKFGVTEDVVLGFDNFERYKDIHPYFGSIVGRYANRIANGQFMIDQHTYQLSLNEEVNHLHGGFKGLDKVLWEEERVLEGEKFQGVVLTHVSPEGHEGYPGQLVCKVTIGLSENNEVSLHYNCTSDQSTPVNFTHHDYFNLKDGGKSSALDHHLQIRAKNYTEKDRRGLPTGKISTLPEALDFNRKVAIREKLKKAPKNFAGFDHNYVLDKKPGELTLGAILYDPESGRKMEVLTTQPGIQFYSAAPLGNDQIVGKKGMLYGESCAVCLETQHFPDSPNHENFPATIIHPGKAYDEKVVYRFSLD